MTHPFPSIVQQSRVLSSEQKELFLDDWETLPESYRQRVASLLLAFDEHSRTREVHLRQKVEEMYKQFAQRLELEGIEGEERKTLLAKARKQIEAFFPAVKA